MFQVQIAFHGPLPDKIFLDPYILGFITGACGSLFGIAKIKPKANDIAIIFLEVLGALGCRDSLIEKVLDEINLPENILQYKAGDHAAFTLMALLANSVLADDNADVLEIRNWLVAQGRATDRHFIAAYLRLKILDARVSELLA